MPDSAQSQFRTRQVTSEGLPIHVIEAGRRGDPAILFLHGWPQDSTCRENVMLKLAPDAHVLAIDLPGIGKSTQAPPTGKKRDIARIVRAALDELELGRVTLVGNDAGGMIVYAFLREHPERLNGAVIMNVVIPGVDPWEEVWANPQIWHWRFNAIPDLPETLVDGHQKEFFAFFLMLAAHPTRIDLDASARAYATREALKAGNDWFRAFPEDAKANAGFDGEPCDVPLLYVRGAEERGIPIERYVAGFREAGLSDVRPAVIPDAGHFPMDEQPEALAEVLHEFVLASPR